MGLAQEQFIAEFCDAWADGSQETKPDIEKILSMIAEEPSGNYGFLAALWLKVKTTLREEIQRQVRIASNNKCYIINALSAILRLFRSVQTMP